MHARPIGIAITLALGLAGACGHRRSQQEDPFPAAIARVDAAWQDRGRAGFPPVAEALDQLETIAPGHPELRWRRARLELAVGLAGESYGERRAGLASARGEAMACLSDAPAFRLGWRRGAWSEAVESVPAERLGCLAFAALSWVRGGLDLDAAAVAIDRERVDALVAEGPASAWPEHRWASALVAAASGDTARASASRAVLEALIEQVDEPAWVRADLALIVAPALRDANLRAEQARALSARPPSTPEGRRAAEIVSQD